MIYSSFCILLILAIKYQKDTQLKIFSNINIYLFATGLLDILAGGWIIKLVVNGNGLCTAVFTGGPTAHICC
jgi:hypothetical protein